jgi:Terpene synthase family 2, C-terminal metal binding
LTELERELERQRPAIAAEIQGRLTRDIAEQAMAHCRCRGGVTAHARHAHGAATYDVHCAPTDAGYRERLRDAQFLLCFFIANELEITRLLAFIDHAPRIWAGQETSQGELEANYAVLAGSLRRSGYDHHAFHAEFLRMCQAMRDEQDADPATIPKQRYVTLRRYTIAVLPMLAYWDAQRAVRFGHRAQQLWASSAITELVLDAIWLCNDLFSLDNDLAPPKPDGPQVSLNGILIDARDSGDLAGAIAAGEAEYHQKTLDIEQVIRHATAVAADLNEPLLPFRARSYARMVNGNLRGHQIMMPIGYPGAAGRLPSLRMIEY